VLEPGHPFVDGIHIRLICDALERVTRGELLRLIINIPPRYGKSNIVSVLWPVWVWITDPRRDFLTASYGQSLAETHSGAARRLIESPEFQYCYRDAFALSSDVNQRGRYDNDRGGKRFATSIGGAATGHGGDILIVDDPLKADEAHSKLARETMIDTFDYTFSTRLNNPQTGAIVVVSQRLHERDLTGHLIERGDWELLCLPAEYDPKHPYRYEHDPRTLAGEPLWPEMYGPEQLAELKKPLGSFGVASQFQQLPAPDGGGIFLRSSWQWFDLAKELGQPFEEVLVSIDLAFEGGIHSDYCVAQVWGKRGKNYYLLHQLRARLSFRGQAQMVLEALAWAEQNVNYPYTPAVYLEKAANGAAVFDVLRDQVSRLLPVVPKGDKQMRAFAVSHLVEAKQVYLPGAANSDGTSYDRTLTPDWVQGLVNECAAFPKGAHDDQVDALVQALMKLDRKRPQFRSFG
jgi:predicted phage terminase large subunit-like protein